ncbi:hypothetical protein [Pseudomonas piscis]|uniref:hypothetical protein n=1 Tax=Pseudomonas piscis TaxID=2614538 RepID=UPI001F3FC680|nr:hypothetical protein [Pseudomonas piscis]
MALIQLLDTNPFQQRGDPLHRSQLHGGFYCRQVIGRLIGRAGIELLFFLQPLRLLHGLLIGIAQALESLRVFVRAGLFQQLGVMALDRAGVRGGRQAEQGPATHWAVRLRENRGGAR